MSRRAFVPAALVEAQPRVYKSFRGRQLKGLAWGVIGAGLVIAVMGVRDFTGYFLAFLAALPGFAYGYYQPEGRPIEAWIRVLYRYYGTSQRISAVRPRRRWSPSVWLAQFDPVLRAAWHVIRYPQNPTRRNQPVGGR